MNWTSKQNVSSAALQIKTSEITVHLWSLYFLHFERAIVSREMKRKWVYSLHMSSDIPWQFGCIQFSYCCSKGILRRFLSLCPLPTSSYFLLVQLQIAQSITEPGVGQGPSEIQ